MTVVTPKMLAAAWDAWSPRRGDPDRKLGPGPAFKEAVEAAVAEGLRSNVLVTLVSQVELARSNFELLEAVQLHSVATAAAQEEARNLRAQVDRLQSELEDERDYNNGSDWLS